MGNGGEKMGPERSYIRAPARRRVESRGLGQGAFKDHTVDGGQKQQRRAHGRARGMRFERGQARAAGSHVLGDSLQKPFIHRRAELGGPPGLIKAPFGYYLAIHVLKNNAEVGCSYVKLLASARPYTSSAAAPWEETLMLHNAAILQDHGKSHAPDRVRGSAQQVLAIAAVNTAPD